MIEGSIPALITPMRDGVLDETALADLVERHIAAGTHALAPCGTTGESATLTDAEHERVVTIVVRAAAGRIPVIAGCGAAGPAHAIALAKTAKRIGADAALIVTPYYNRPSQDGLFAHFKAIHDAVQLPVILYNVPVRTGVDLLPETVARLAQLPNVIGLKDASRDLERTPRHRALCGDDFILLSGEDGTALGFNAMGGTGCISVTANAAPEACAALQNAMAAGAWTDARAINARLADLHRAMFCEPSPAPAKYAASLRGWCSDEARLPIVGLSDGAKEIVRAALVKAGAELAA
ncbi:MAG: 4-hydroxy-tetrahydrodipicolinate synthase [Alphaproteobacteria bacterium]|nr:4-hydroxy-tetrahydrodipicolinate synthase [Alphaproteobacteria bacterium]